MDDILIDNFSRMIRQLLSPENRNKLLGEIPEEFEQYIIDIRNMVDSGSITYEQLQSEISRNLDIREEPRPGSVAQMLLGCTREESCPIRQEEILDVPYFYDTKDKTLIPITRISSAITPDSYAIIYLTGDPSGITKETFAELKRNGFNKVKIMYKNSTKSKYNMKVIEDLSKNNNILSNFNFNNIGTIIGIVSVLALLLSILYFKFKKT